MKSGLFFGPENEKVEDQVIQNPPARKSVFFNDESPVATAPKSNGPDIFGFDQADPYVDPTELSVVPNTTEPSFLGNIKLGAKAIGRGASEATDLALQSLGGFVKGTDVNVSDSGYVDEMIAKNRADAQAKALSPAEKEQRLGPIKAGDIEGGAANIGFSAANMIPQAIAQKIGTKIGARLGGPTPIGQIVGGVAGNLIAGMGTGYVLAKRADMNMILRDKRDQVLKINPNMTEAEWQTVKNKVLKEVDKHGTAEGKWEAFGNTLQLALMALGQKWGARIPLRPAVSKALGVIASTAVDIPLEVGSEALTQMDQAEAERAMGLREPGKPLSFFEAVGEIGPQTLVTTALSMGAGGAAHAVLGGKEQQQAQPQPPPIPPEARVQAAEDAMRSGDEDALDEELDAAVQDITESMDTLIEDQAQPQDQPLAPMPDQVPQPETNPVMATPERPVRIDNQPSRGQLTPDQFDQTINGQVSPNQFDSMFGEPRPAAIQISPQGWDAAFPKEKRDQIEREQELAYAEALRSFANRNLQQDQARRASEIAQDMERRVQAETAQRETDLKAQRQRSNAEIERRRLASRMTTVLYRFDRGMKGIGEDFVQAHSEQFTQMADAIRANNPGLAETIGNMILKDARRERNRMRVKAVPGEAQPASPAPVVPAPAQENANAIPVQIASTLGLRQPAQGNQPQGVGQQDQLRQATGAGATQAQEQGRAVPQVERQAPEVQDPYNMVSKSGRKLSPFPDKPVTSDQVAGRRLRGWDEWLVKEAIAEAKANGDDYVANLFSGELPVQKHGLPQASRDMANDYLFGRESVKLDWSKGNQKDEKKGAANGQVQGQKEEVVRKTSKQIFEEKRAQKQAQPISAPRAAMAGTQAPPAPQAVTAQDNGGASISSPAKKPTSKQIFEQKKAKAPPPGYKDVEVPTASIPAVDKRAKELGLVRKGNKYVEKSAAAPVVVEEKPSGETVVSVPSEDKGKVPPATQKKFFMAELDKAIELAPDEARATGEWTKADETRLKEAEARESEATARERSLKPMDMSTQSALNDPKIHGAMLDAERAVNEAFKLRREKARKTLEHVTIEVPGDGTFTVVNTKANLQAIKKKMGTAFDKPKEDLPTLPSGEPTPYGVSPRPPSLNKDKWDKLMEPFTVQGKKEKSARPLLAKPHYENNNGEVVATDSRRLAVAFNVKPGAKGIENYPRYTQVVPGYRAGKLPDVSKTHISLKIADTEAFARKLNQAYALLKDSGQYGETVVLYKMPDGTVALEAKDAEIGDYQSGDFKKGEEIGAFNIPFLMDAVGLMRKTGNKEAMLHYQDNTSPLLITGKQEYVVQMPIRRSSLAMPGMESAPALQMTQAKRRSLLMKMNARYGQYATFNVNADGVITMTAKRNGTRIRVEAVESLPNRALAQWVQNGPSNVIRVVDTGEVSHEMTHAMRDLGMINDLEWTRLAKAAREATPERVEKINKRYKDAGYQLTPDDLDHELVAQYINDVAEGRIDAGANRNLVQKVLDFFRELARALGLGTGSTAGLIKRTARGEQLGVTTAGIAGTMSAMKSRLAAAKSGMVDGVTLYSRAGIKPRYPDSYEWNTAKNIVKKLGSEGRLEIYDQAETGSLYGNIVFHDGRIFPVRISDHPTRTTAAIIDRARKEAVVPGSIKSEQGRQSMPADEQKRDQTSAPVLSRELESEIQYRIENSREEVETGGADEALTRTEVLRELMQDADDKDTVAYTFRKELQNLGIQLGIYKEYSKEQLDGISQMGRGKKYDFKRGDKFYLFESWSGLNKLAESSGQSNTRASLGKDYAGAKAEKDEEAGGWKLTGADGTVIRAGFTSKRMADTYRRIKDGSYTDAVIEATTSKGKEVYGIKVLMPSGKYAFDGHFFPSEEAADRFLAHRQAAMDEGLDYLVGENKDRLINIAAARKQVFDEFVRVSTDDKLGAQEAKEQIAASVKGLVRALGGNINTDTLRSLSERMYSLLKDPRRASVERKVASINRFIEKTVLERARKSVRKAIADEMAKAAVIYDNRTGKLKNPDYRYAHDAVKFIRDSANWTVEQMDEEIERLIESDPQNEMRDNPPAEEGDGLSNAEKINLIQQFSGFAAEQDFTKLNETLEALKELTAQKVAKFKAEQKAKREYYEAEANEYAEQLGFTGTDNALVNQERERSVAAKMKKFWNAFHGKILSGQYAFRAMDQRKNVDPETAKSMTLERMEHKARSDEANTYEPTRDAFLSVIGRAFGVNPQMGRADRRKMLQKLKDFKRVPKKTGVHAYSLLLDETKAVIGTEQGGEMLVNKDNLTYVYALMRRAESEAGQSFNNTPATVEGWNNSLMRRLVKKGYTAETKAEIESFIGQEGIDLAEGLNEWVQTEVSPKVRQLLLKKFGVVPPIYDFYVPMNTDRISGDQDITGGAAGGIDKMVYSWMKRPSYNTYDFKPSSIIDQYMRHVSEVNHAVSWMDVVEYERRVFKSRKLQEGIRSVMGDEFRRHVNEHIKRIALGTHAVVHNMIADRITRRFSTSVIHSPTQFVKQFSAAPMLLAFAPNTASKAAMMAHATARFWLNPVSTFRFAQMMFRESPVFRNRYAEGMNIYMRIAESPKGEQYMKTHGPRSLFHWMTHFTKYGDMASAVYMGPELYDAWYKDSIKRGMDPAAAKKEAIFRVDQAIEKGLQSSHAEHLSSAQTDAFWKHFQLFNTQPVAMTRLWVSTVNDIIKGRGSRASNISKLASIYMSQAFWQFAADGLGVALWGADDDDEWKRIKNNQIRTAALVPLGGFAITYSLAERFIRSLQKEPVFRDFASDAMPATSVMQTFDDVLKVAAHWFNDELTEADMTRLATAGGDMLGLALSTPVAPAVRWGVGIKDAIQNQSGMTQEQRIMRGLGWGKKAVGQPQESKAAPQKAAGLFYQPEDYRPTDYRP